MATKRNQPKPKPQAKKKAPKPAKKPAPKAAKPSKPAKKPQPPPKKAAPPKPKPKLQPKAAAKPQPKPRPATAPPSPAPRSSQGPPGSATPSSPTLSSGLSRSSPTPSASSPTDGGVRYLTVQDIVELHPAVSRKSRRFSLRAADVQPVPRRQSPRGARGALCVLRAEQPHDRLARARREDRGDALPPRRRASRDGYRSEE